MRRIFAYQLLIILIFSISCSGRSPEAQEDLSSHPKRPEILSSDQPKLSPAAEENKNYVPGEILVKFKDGTTDQAIEAIQRELHLETIRVVSKPNLYLMKILNTSSVVSTVERLRHYREVQYAEPNYIRKIN
jgi:hypothetical protein